MNEQNHIKNGDVFRWRYRDEQPDDRRSFGRYHCKSMIVIARDGYLIDTFWGGSSYNRWEYENAATELDLIYLGNLSDFEKKPEYMNEYYDEDDCLDLNHSNSSSGNFYVRKNAKRSREKMRDVINQKIREEEARIRSSEYNIECLEKSLSHINEENTPLEKIYT